MHRFKALHQEQEKIAYDHFTKRCLRTAIGNWKGKNVRYRQYIILFEMLSAHTEVCKRLGDARALQDKWENKRKQEYFDLWRMATETEQAVKENQIAYVNKVHTTYNKIITVLDNIFFFLHCSCCSDD